MRLAIDKEILSITIPYEGIEKMLAGEIYVMDTSMREIWLLINKEEPDEKIKPSNVTEE